MTEVQVRGQCKGDQRHPNITPLIMDTTVTKYSGQETDPEEAREANRRPEVLQGNNIGMTKGNKMIELLEEGQESLPLF